MSPNEFEFVVNQRPVITYRVLIVNVRQSSISTCRPYLLLSGTLADTQPVYFSNDRFQVSFQHKNLGILTTLRIGMDNPNGNGRWLIDHIVVRNEFTGRVYKSVSFTRTCLQPLNSIHY